MRKQLLIIAFICSVKAGFTSPPKHVILISIDGMRPEMYLDSAWHTPNLKRLMVSGTYARFMTSVFPSYTYPAHVGMLTGKRPDESGIAYNTSAKGNGEWNWFLKDIKAATLWQALKKAGISTAAVEWPVSVGADITYNIPEIWSKEHPGDRITETRRYATPGLIEEIETNFTGPLNAENMDESKFSLDQNSAKMAAYIFRKYKPGLLALHFAGVDGMQHQYGRDADSVRLAVENVDNAIGSLLDVVRTSGSYSNTTILIVGDHGFSDIHEAIFPEKWLYDAGIKGYDMRTAGGSAFFYLREKGKVKTVDSILYVLKSLPDSISRLFRVIQDSELRKMGADKDALIALAAKPSIVFGAGNVVGFKSVRGGHHGYDPELPEMHTGFIAAGAGIKTGSILNNICVTDIASIIAELFSIDFIKGKMNSQVLK